MLLLASLVRVRGEPTAVGNDKADVMKVLIRRFAENNEDLGGGVNPVTLLCTGYREITSFPPLPLTR